MNDNEKCADIEKKMIDLEWEALQKKLRTVFLDDSEEIPWFCVISDQQISLEGDFSFDEIIRMGEILKQELKKHDNKRSENLVNRIGSLQLPKFYKLSEEQQNELTGAGNPLDEIQVTVKLQEISREEFRRFNERMEDILNEQFASFLEYIKNGR